MKNLFDQEPYQSILNRLELLRPEAAPVWGKMQASQMLAHCYRGLETATGRKLLKRLLLGKLIGGFFKNKFINEEAFSKNSPTHPYFMIADKRNFDTEKMKLKQILKEFHEGGPEKCTRQEHSFFGPLTPEQWAIGMYKHLDHHLRQFGV